VKKLKFFGVIIGAVCTLATFSSCNTTPANCVNGSTVYYRVAQISGNYAAGGNFSEGFSIATGSQLEFELYTSNNSSCPLDGSSFQLVEDSPKPDWVASKSISGTGSLVVAAKTMKYNALEQLIVPSSADINKSYQLTINVTNRGQTFSKTFLFKYAMESGQFIPIANLEGRTIFRNIPNIVFFSSGASFAGTSHSVNLISNGVTLQNCVSPSLSNLECDIRSTLPAGNTTVTVLYGRTLAPPNVTFYVEREYRVFINAI
jgi:hypothetical protein